MDPSVLKRFLSSPTDTLIFQRFLLSEEVSTEGFAASDAGALLDWEVTGSVLLPLRGGVRGLWLRCQSGINQPPSRGPGAPLGDEE